MKLKKKIVLMIVAIFFTTVAAMGIYVTTAYFFSTNELSKTFKTYKGYGSSSKAIKQTKPISILLMGVDTGSAERTSTWEGNSDSMILVTINPKTKKTTMTSLQRDILITLSGPQNNDMNGVEAKLNAAYAAGGAEMAIKTVQDLLDMNIDYYMQINMKGLVDLVNAVGGVTVTNNFDFPITISDTEPEYTATVEPGTHQINGDQALVYSRMRHDDPEGDYGRQKRQQEVIEKVVKKILALNSISSYKKILSAISGNMQTNIEISSSTIPSILGYSDSVKNIETYQLKGEDATIDGISYQIATTDDLLKIQNMIKSELGLTPSTTLTTTAILYENLYGSSYGYNSSSDYNAYSDSTSSYTQDQTQGYTGGY